MNTEKIYLEFESKEFECEVSFNFTKGEPRITHLLPEDCCEGSPDEYEITDLYIHLESKRLGVEAHDIGFLIDSLSEEIIQQLEEIRNES